MLCELLLMLLIMAGLVSVSIRAQFVHELVANSSR
jgi:hypothetical protein